MKPYNHSLTLNLRVGSKRDVEKRCGLWCESQSLFQKELFGVLFPTWNHLHLRFPPPSILPFHIHLCFREIIIVIIIIILIPIQVRNKRVKKGRKAILIQVESMSMSCLVMNCCSSTQYYAFQRIPAAMAMRSSTFCPYNHTLISYPSSPFNLKRFSSHISNSTASSSSQPQPQVIETPARVGFLGIGIMGSPMAHNLLKAGIELTVWNRTKSKCDPLISLGAKYKSSPEEVAASCDVTFAMLADPQTAMDVACGKHGATNGMGPGKGYVDVSTVDGSTSKLINGHIKSTGALFLEAPVSGSKKPAEDGQLIFLTAGDKNLYDTVAPFLDIMGKSRFYLGDVGNGAAMKLVVNMIMGSMMASFSEGLLLSQKVGLDPNVLVEVVSQGAINAPMYSTKGPSMIQSLYPTAFPLKHQQKDLRLALGLAESVSQPTPIAAAANELYKVAKSHGLSDQDFSAVIEALKSKFQQSENQ